MGFFTRLTAGLKKTATALSDKVVATVTGKRKLDQALLEDLETVLLQADVGLPTTTLLLNDLRQQRFGQDVTAEEIKTILSAKITALLTPVAQPLTLPSTKPTVILLCGVNGAGKTTTLAKLAEKFRQQKKKVLVAAGDTYRAGAADQLAVWAKRVGCPIIQAERDGADPAALLYQAYQQAQAEKFDILLADTAGRLHNRKDLMDQLEKIIRVLQKIDPAAPHLSLLVLDATVGQNAMAQVDVFAPAAKVTGLVVTKLDSTAKGGAILALAERYKLPIHFVGVGESVDDLDSFKPDEFAQALLQTPTP